MDPFDIHPFISLDKSVVLIDKYSSFLFSFEQIRYDGSPRVVYLESVLAKAGIKGRVILPITGTVDTCLYIKPTKMAYNGCILTMVFPFYRYLDPYVAHHGALGSFAWVYLDDPSHGMGLLRARE